MSSVKLIFGFRNTRTEQKVKAQVGAIIDHAGTMLTHPTLKTKFRLKSNIIDFETSIKSIFSKDLAGWIDEIPSINLKKGTMHMLLLGDTDATGAGGLGIAKVNSICMSNNR